MKSVSHNANVFCGDGTTAAAVLTASIFNNSVKYIESGVNPIIMQRGIQKGKKVVEEFLNAIKHKIDYQNDIQVINQVAKVAVNYDLILSEIISSTMTKIGPFGKTHIEPSYDSISHVDILEGISINRGFCSSGLLKTTIDSEITLNEPFVLLLNFNVKDLNFILPAIEHSKKIKKPLFIIAKELSEEVISQLVFNRKKNNIDVFLKVSCD